MNERHPRCTVENLAPETLSEIFLYCLPQTPLRISPSTSRPPLQLTFVCPRWRSVALATPGLWTRVNIVLNLMPRSKLNTPDAFAQLEQKVQCQKEGVVRWLTQAANLPTHVSFHMTHGPDWSPKFRNMVPGVVLEALGEICSERFTNKWETLDIGGEDWRDSIAHPYREFFLSIPKEHLTSLKTLHYTYKSPPIYAIDQAHRVLTFRASGIGAAPSLEAIHITRLHHDDTLGKLPAWTNLTKLSLMEGYTPSRAFKTEEVLQVISQCAATLRDLHASVGAPEDPSLNVTTIVLPRLEFMTIIEHGCEGDPPSALQQFMSTLVTPILSEMRFETGCSPEFAYQDEVSSLLIFVQVHQLNLSNLTDVRFEYNWLNPDELTELLGTLGAPEMSVTCLHLEGTWVSYRDMGGQCPYATMDSWDLEQFNPPRAEEDMPMDGTRDVAAESRLRRSPLFPKLEQFYVRLAKEDEFDDGDLLAFLRPRVQRYKNESSSFQNHQLVRLFSVQVTFVSESNIDIMEELQALEDVDLDGVDIEIEYGGDGRWSCL
ncbi:hypothetical protein BKA70DRAFT_1154233 [Coprinopsis sp. MPI-PUGE-AT-0042]|nr:hypothetical protein BKA70DRAFT_1154233 [Coprinopsis sp. MPI-PUGE-AT-0042]